MISTALKNQIVEAIKSHSSNYRSYIKQGTALGISASQLSRVINGDIDGVLSDANWLNIARKYDVSANGQAGIETAKTIVFNHIWAQLEFAQKNSVSGILCDRADIGKTHTAVVYARENKNVAYVDCGRAKTKYHFVRAISKEFGLTTNGGFNDIFENLVFYLKTIDKPLIILDEFGDLRYETYLEFKALWNATDKNCAWYAMGADGLKVKIDRSIGRNKLGFAEIFSRLGNKFQRITPLTDQEFTQFQKQQIATIGKANGCEDVQKLHVKTNLSLRRIPVELAKQKAAAHEN